MGNLFVATTYRYAVSILPWFFIGLLLASIIGKRVKPTVLQRYLAGYNYRKMFLALLLGMISPLSIMSFLPIANEIVASGANPGMIFSFFIAERAYDLQSFFIISSLFGFNFALLNALAILISLFSAALVIRHEQIRFATKNNKNSNNFVTRQFKLLLIVVLGILVGALFRVIIPADHFSSLTGGTVTGIMGGSLLGLVLYFGPIIGNYPVAKSFADLGMSQSGIFAFLTISPVFNIVVIVLFGGTVGFRNTYKALLTYAFTALLLTLLCSPFL